MGRARRTSAAADEVRAVLAARLERGEESVAEIALAIGVSRQQVYQFRRGADSQISFVDALARRLGVRLGLYKAARGRT